MAKEKSESVQLVIAVYDNESAAVGAQAGLEHWAGLHRDIKLGAIGVLQLVDGEVVPTLIRKEGSPLVSGAMGLLKTMLGPLALVGNVVSGVAKSVFGNGDEETPEAIQKLAAAMDAGGVTMVLAVSTEEAPAYSRQLQSMGGRVTVYEVPAEVVEEVHRAVETAQAEAEAAEKAEKEAEKAAKEAEKAAKADK